MPGPEKLSFLSTQVSGSVLFHLVGDTRFAGIQVICGGLEPCRPEYRMDRKHFPYFCIEMVAAGSCRVDLGKGPRVLGPGSFFTYGPGVPQKIETILGGSLLKYFIDFTGPKASSLLAGAGFKPGTMARCPNADEARNLFDSLITLGQAGGAKATHHLLQALVAHLAANPQQPREPKPGEASFHRLRHHLDHTFLSPQTLVETCAQLGLSPAYACRLFQTHMAMSPWKYLTARRMKHAAALLSRGDGKVTEVARAMGYPDPYSFSRVFKRVYGVAPHTFSVKSFKKFKVR